jgi:hypothetical protein
MRTFWISFNEGFPFRGSDNTFQEVKTTITTACAHKYQKHTSKALKHYITVDENAESVQIICG